VWLLFPYHPIGCYVDVQTHPKYRVVFEASKDRAIMLDRRVLSAPFHTADVTEERDQVADSGGTGTRGTLRFGSESLVSEQLETAQGTRVRKLLSKAEELEAFLNFPVETDPVRITAALDRQLPAYLKEREEFPSEYGAMMLCLGEPIGRLYQVSRLDEYAVWSLTHSDSIEAWLRRGLERLRVIYTYCLERDLADVYFLVGSELASPPLVSRSTFQRWIVPFARDLISLIHSYGKRVIQHYHGQIREILPDFLTMAPDGLHTIEAPPVGDCTMSEAFDVVQNRITLIGNVQYDEFRSLSPEGMRQRVYDLLDECRDKRFILSPTAGPYDPDIPESMVRNLLAFMDAAENWNRGRRSHHTGGNQ
jgi:hypothetical protein